MKKKIASLCAVLLLLFVTAVPAYASEEVDEPATATESTTGSVTEAGYHHVLDSGNVLSEENSRKIEEAAAEVYARNGVELFAYVTGGKLSKPDDTGKSIYSSDARTDAAVIMMADSKNSYIRAYGRAANIFSSTELKNILKQAKKKNGKAERLLEFVSLTGSVLADQWREFFYCESLPKDVLVVKGQKVITSRSSNTKGNDNIISNGSGIAVADGQAMIIVEQGKVVEYCEIPGEYTYDSSTEPSIFAGSFGQSILETFKVIGKRFTFGGDTAKDQRVYYFNTKEIPENLFGTSRPVPFRVVDKNIGLDIDVSVRCNGTYSYKIVNPLLFYTNVCGNVSAEYRRKEIDAQLKSEFVNALPPAFSRISAMQIRPNELGGHLPDVCDALNAELSAKWLELRGIKVVSVAFNAIDLPEEDLQMIKTAQRNAINRDPGMAAATLVGGAGRGDDQECGWSRWLQWPWMRR